MQNSASTIVLRLVMLRKLVQMLNTARILCRPRYIASYTKDTRDNPLRIWSIISEESAPDPSHNISLYSPLSNLNTVFATSFPSLLIATANPNANLQELAALTSQLENTLTRYLQQLTLELAASNRLPYLSLSLLFPSRPSSDTLRATEKESLTALIEKIPHPGSTAAQKTKTKTTDQPSPFPAYPNAGTLLKDATLSHLGYPLTLNLTPFHTQLSKLENVQRKRNLSNPPSTSPEYLPALLVDTANRAVRRAPWAFSTLPILSEFLESTAGKPIAKLFADANNTSSQNLAKTESDPAIAVQQLETTLSILSATSTSFAYPQSAFTALTASAPFITLQRLEYVYDPLAYTPSTLRGGFVSIANLALRCSPPLFNLLQAFPTNNQPLPNSLAKLRPSVSLLDPSNSSLVLTFSDIHPLETPLPTPQHWKHIAISLLEALQSNHQQKLDEEVRQQTLTKAKTAAKKLQEMEPNILKMALELLQKDPELKPPKKPRITKK